MGEELSSGGCGVQAVEPVSDAAPALEGAGVGSTGVASAERAVFVACSPPVFSAVPCASPPWRTVHWDRKHMVWTMLSSGMFWSHDAHAREHRRSVINSVLYVCVCTRAANIRAVQSATSSHITFSFAASCRVSGSAKPCSSHSAK